MSPAATKAREVILASASDCLDKIGRETLRGQRATVLLAMAEHDPILTPFAIRQLESYAATMHRNPPTPRTILNLLQWLTTTEG